MTKPTREQRFWAKVDKTGPLPKYAPFLGPCWVWTAGTDQGYGRFAADRSARLAHRVGYEMVVGPVPDGLELDHLCRVRSCVNPDHLEPVTHRENVLRSETVTAINARKTHCKNGHEFTEENTYPYPDGRRECRKCKKAGRNRDRTAA